MNRQRLALLVIAALVIAGAGLYVGTTRNEPAETPGVPLLPALATGVNSVTTVMIRKGSATPTLTVHKSGADWTVAERADYPADVTKVRKLLLALRDAKIVEQKTADPARFASIGVDDPVTTGAVGAEVTVLGPTLKESVIVGKAAGEGNFVRRMSDNETFAVEPGISVETEPRFWIDSRLLDVPAALLQTVAVTLPGTAYTLHRLNPADNTFSLEGVPPGRQALDGHALAPTVTTFGNLTAEDVTPAKDLDFSHASQVVMTLTDGNVVTLTGTVVADKHWITVAESKDATLTARAQGRAFEIASYRYDALFKPVEQLLVPKAPPPGPPPPAAAPKLPTTHPATPAHASVASPAPGPASAATPAPTPATAPAPAPAAKTPAAPKVP